MESYATTAYYRDEYHGQSSGTDEELERLLLEASIQIDRLTFRRGRVRRLTDFQQEYLQQACCHQADYIEANGGPENALAGVNSYSVLDISINMGDGKSKTPAMVAGFSEMGYALLEQTGLMGRMI